MSHYSSSHKSKIIDRMKKFLTLCFMGLAIGVNTSDADIIVMQDGTSLNVYNVEETDKWVLYTTGNSMESELKRIPIEDVFALKKGDAGLHTVGTKSEGSGNYKMTASDTVTVSSATDEENGKLIGYYNSAKVTNIKKEADTKKFRKGAVTAIWDVAPGSVLQDENLRLSIVPVSRNNENTYKYKITLKNISDDNVYVDVAKSFRITDGKSESFYDDKVYTTVVTKSASNAKSKTNGTKVLRGESKDIQMSESIPAVLTIPPGGQVEMPMKRKVVNGNVVTEAERFYLPGTYRQTSKQLGLYDYGLVDVEEPEATHSYIIAYSKKEDLQNGGKLKFVLKLRQLFGREIMGFWDSNPNFIPGDGLLFGDGWIEKE